MTASREVWQSCDCPVHGRDADLFGDQMVYRCQELNCAWCDGIHSAGFGVDIETFVEVDGERQYPDLPETAEELQRLKDGA